ncbi:MAG TPA: DUF1828 domain-containing protein [Acidobacteriaceae bacterium]|nr:DUF1828 domain-containing protein [Acidobacteriaceae bacterium]
MSTPFMYPNGEYVDLFLDSQHPLLNTYKLSDYGQTSQYLRSSLVLASSTARKREIIRDITSQLNVSFSGDLYINLAQEEIGDISDAIRRLSQACVRISDLATHQRLRSANPFRDDVEDFFEASHLAYTPDVRIVGQFGKDVRIDFEVKNGNRQSYVNVLAALNESAAHASANEIFIKWHDLLPTGKLSNHKLVTVYNSLSTAIREVDLARLKETSNVVSYPDEQDYLASLLSGDESSSVPQEVLA